MGKSLLRIQLVVAEIGLTGMSTSVGLVALRLPLYSLILVLSIMPAFEVQTRHGYVLTWVSCSLQLVAILTSVLGSRSSQEDLVEEAREQAKFAVEMGAFGGVEMANYDQQGMQPQIQPHLDSQMQPQMQMYRTGMGRFQQTGSNLAARGGSAGVAAPEAACCVDSAAARTAPPRRCHLFCCVEPQKATSSADIVVPPV
ncbi:unnamed protein product [Prorocentrum cordatum]|uniref:Uncharacterized protein n=1 Tax=Prorocentrum cordatum TaxID=2364126 RepID=A0ABN9X5P5_9DINO|nr:unnamed protein product [Polarella glacialis]